MSWHYGIVKHTGIDWVDGDCQPIPNGGPIYAVHEIYTNPDGTVYARTEGPVELFSEAGADRGALLREIMTIFNDCKKHPIIEEPYQYAKREVSPDA